MKDIKSAHGHSGDSSFLIGSLTPQCRHFFWSDASTPPQILHFLAVTLGGAISAPVLDKRRDKTGPDQKRRGMKAVFNRSKRSAVCRLMVASIWREGGGARKKRYSRHDYHSTDTGKYRSNDNQLTIHQSIGHS